LKLATLALIALGAFAQENGWTNDIVYSDPMLAQKLDVWSPEGKGPFPAAIVVHGGGWVGGDKRIEWVQPLFPLLQQANIVIFTINYRLTPMSPYPAMIQDLEAAIKWVRKNGKKHKADKNRIALIGESAGGHMVAYVGAKGKGDTKVNAVVDFYGAHDLLALAKERDGGDMSRVARALLQKSVDAETEWRLREASPIEYVHKNMPPFLFVHGTGDTTVMCDKMKSLGAHCEVFSIADAPHGMSNWEKNSAFQTYKPKIVDWLKATLR
jgi:acetyl esterase